jgi:lipopolysaccharide transport system ATP-binding protein
VLFVSHNLDAVATLCDRVIWLDEGRIFLDGSAQEVVSRYLETLLTSGQEERKAAAAQNKVFHFKQFFPVDEAHRPLTFVTQGADLQLQLKYTCQPEIAPAKVLVNIVFGHARLNNLISCPCEFTGQDLMNQTREGSLFCKIPSFPLVPGIYEIRIAALVNELLVDKVTGLIRVAEKPVDGSLTTTGQPGLGRKLDLKRLRGNFWVDYQWSLSPKD